MRKQSESEAAASCVNDVEMSSLLTAECPSEEEDLLEVPPLTSYVSNWRFWWMLLKWPTALLFANGVVIFISAILFTVAQANKPKMVTFFSILTALLLGDTFALYRGARCVEEQVSKLEEVSSESSFWSPHLVSAKVSKQLDSFFSQGRAIPKKTFLVNLLFALCALSLSASAMSLASIGFLVSPKGHKECFKQYERASPAAQATDDKVRSFSNGDSDPTPVDGIPSTIQRWASEYGRSYRYGGDYASYIHLSNGWTFFSGSKLMEEERDDVMIEPILVGASPNGTLTEYSDILNPRSFVAINNRTNEFCCFYKNLTKTLSRRGWEDTNGKINVLCYQETGLSSAAWKWRHSRHEYFSDSDMKYYNGTLWLKLRTDDYPGEYVQIATMNLTAMKITDVTTIDVSYHTSRHGRRYPGDSCTKSMWWLDVFVGLIVSIFSSAWLIKINKIPSGVTPACVMMNLMLCTLNDQVGYALGFFGAIAATLFLFTASVRPREQRDMLLWALYTTLMVMGAQAAFSDAYFDPLVVLVPLVALTVVIGLLLNHPLLQVMGWLGAIVTLILALTAFVSPMFDAMEVLLLVTPIGLVMSCGLAALGYKIGKCRPYFVVYTRRVWRAMKAAEARASQRNGSRTDESGLRDGLLGNQ